ncbi:MULTISPECIES: phospho-sugar mutase [unclassified Halobacillus]|uniref:phospho-sugar mutase n=1 Tax=unclassified Halobacillus TaxID=2636472 RepID=UPI0002A5183F|nr:MULTISPECIES: phospho-sugar mutase [unclassified Halobacillus]ELK48740.1 phosphoglucomutase [Halobacillus sp. BAB-2008]
MWKEQYERWKEFKGLDAELSTKLGELSEDEQSLEDAFYKDLEFGTGGMRGKLGPGTNRMNIYTVRKAAEGLAAYVNDQGMSKKGVAIAYDSRYMSKEFAVETARVLGAHGIPSYVFTSLRPTPELSFAVRHLGAAAGVVVTASHNPPEYNGFKAYNEDGGQLPPEQAEIMIDFVNKVENELEVDAADQKELEENGLLRWIDEEVDQAYLKALESVTVQKEIDKDLSLVFTPLHGTARHLVEKGLAQSGFTSVHIVEEQAKPDPEFSTVASPNPEEHQAFEIAIEQGKAIGADLLLATDPDADRLGVAVPDENGEYQVLTGNQTGALMLDYILGQSAEIPKNGRMIKTIVTSEFGRVIADSYGISSLDTLTGFKFIGEKIREYEQTKEHTFLFGYEESYGYLVKDFARDKDAVQSAVLIAEVGAYYKNQGKTLLDALNDLYEKHGFFLEGLQSMKLEGKAGADTIQTIMNDFREADITEAGGKKVVAVEDYSTSIRRDVESGSEEHIDLPASNVVKFILEDDCWFCLRPSGTEPKIKFYYGVKSGAKADSEALLEAVKATVNERLHALI